MWLGEVYAPSTLQLNANYLPLKIKSLSLKAFYVLECFGMSDIDFLISLNSLLLKLNAV